jgi:hypothetical protein
MLGTPYAGGGQPHPQAPPQQPPPVGMLAPSPAPVSAIVESSLTVFVCPSGQAAGSDEALIGRCTSNVVVHSWQRYSYVGTGPLCPVATVIDRASS